MALTLLILPITFLKHELGMKSHIRKFTLIILQCHQHRSIKEEKALVECSSQPWRRPAAARLTDSFGN